MVNIKFAKTNSEGKIPSKRGEDAGYDLFPAFFENYLIIEPNETKLVPLGIASSFDSNYCIIIKERGSTGILGIGQRSGVIDSGYRGEWKAPVTNHGKLGILIIKQGFELTSEYKELINAKEYILYSYDKAIAQALLIPVPSSKVEEVAFENLCKETSERMSGGFGSTNQ